MTITTHLILVSRQPIPNLSPILDENLRPQKIIMLVSTDMQQRSEALEAIYKTRGIAVERCPITDAWNPAQISDTVMDLLDAHPEGSVALNATGGTKLMSIAAYEVFRSNNWPIFYIHPEHDRLIWLSPKQAPVELQSRLKLKDYLTAYGADEVEIPQIQDIDKAQRDFSTTLLQDISRYSNELSTLNALAYQADKPNLTAVLKDKPWPRLGELLDLCQNTGLCTLQNGAVQFASEQARFTANGGWLETHVYNLCYRQKQQWGLQDVGCNITIKRQPAGKATVKNELDVALIKANRLHIIECKTKKVEGGADILYKLDSLRDLMGGLQGKALLVSFNHLDKTSRARAKELKIELCCGDDLSHLQQHLQSWLQTKQISF